MQKIELHNLEEWTKKYKNFKEGKATDRFACLAEDTCERVGVVTKSFQKKKEAVVIYGEPCKSLMELQEKGHCVLAELRHLQGMSEEEVAEALCKEEAVMQYTNVCINALELPQEYLRRIWCKAQGIPVLIAETDRLIIRESTEEDAEAFYELYQDEDCKRYLTPLPIDIENVISDKAEIILKYKAYVAEYIKNQYGFYEYGMWTVVEKDSGTVVGRMGLEATDAVEMKKSVGQQCDGVTESETLEQSSGAAAVSLGYALLPGFRGKGYATEACRAILTYCTECGYADCVKIEINTDNAKSISVVNNLQKNATGAERFREIGLEKSDCSKIMVIREIK